MQTRGTPLSNSERTPAESNVTDIASQKIPGGAEQVDFMACEVEPPNFSVPLNNVSTEFCGEGNCKVQVNDCAPGKINGGCLPSQSTRSMFSNVVNGSLHGNPFSDFVSFLSRLGCPLEKENGFHYTVSAVVAFLEERHAKHIEAASQERAEYEAGYRSYVDTLKIEYEQKVIANESKVQELSREVQKVSQQLSDAQTKLKSSSSRLSFCESETQSSRKEVGSLQAQLATETEQIKSLRNQLSTNQREMSAERKDFSTKMRHSEDARQAAEREVHWLNSKFKENESVANHLRSECKKLSDQLAAIEQKSAQESLTSGSYADGHVNPSMMENACKNVDKVTDSMVRFIHEKSMTSKVSLMKTPEMESFIGKLSLAKPSDFSRPAHVKHVWGHWICTVMFRGFENVFFDLDGDWAWPLDSKVHASACFESFQRNKDVPPSEYYEASATFKAFCKSKYKYLFPVGLLNEGLRLDSVTCDCDGRFGGDEDLYARFLEVAKAIWLLHELAFAFDPPAGILRTGFGTRFERQFHEPLIKDADMISDGMSARVALVVRPAFRVRNVIIKSRVFLSKMSPSLQVHDSSKI